MNNPEPNALLELPEEQQAKLTEWLLNVMPDHKALELSKKEFGVIVPLSCLGPFWDAHGPRAAKARRLRAVRFANEMVEESCKNPGQFEKAALEAIKQKAFERAMAPGADPKDLKILFSLVLASSAPDLALEKLKLDRKKLKLALRKHKDHVESQKKKIESVLTSGNRDGAIPKAVLDRVAEELKLL